MPAAGDRIADRYELLRELGQGAAASVFLGRDVQLDREVAVKLLTGDGMVASPERFRFEAKTLARLQHPHVVTLYDFGREKGRFYLVMEPVRGGSLLDVLGRGPLAPERAAAIGEAVLEALAVAHERGVLHRDVKPENVLMTEEGEPKLSDFGLAKAPTSGIRTRTGILMGTPEFMAPELFTGEVASAASDVYSWGCLVYLLANGRLPFLGNISQIAVAKTKGSFESGREEGRLRDAVHAALSLDPKRRGSARDLLAILRGEAPRHSEDRTVTLSSVSPGGARAPAGRARPLWLGACATAASVGALLLVSVASREDAPEVAPEDAGPRPTPPLVDEWRARLADLDVRTRVATLNDATSPEPGMLDALITDFPQKNMVATRAGVPERARLGALEEALPSLPHRDALRFEREALRAVLADSRIRYEDRRALFHALQELLGLDALYEAWGLFPPYHVRDVLDGLVPVRSRDPPAAFEPAPDLEPGRPLEPGRWSLFRWKRPGDSGWPVIFGEEGELSRWESIAVGQYREESDGAWRLEDHRDVRGSAVLGDLAALGDHDAVLTMHLGGLFSATEMVVEWNGLRVRYPAEPGRAEFPMWNNGPMPGYVLEIPLPDEALRTGENEFLVAIRPLPGIVRCCAVSFDNLELDVRPEQD